MRREYFYFIVLFGVQAGGVPAAADIFGSGPNRFEMEFVSIGQPGNPPGATGCASALCARFCGRR
jgi:hypothetical protein